MNHPQPHPPGHYGAPAGGHLPEPPNATLVLILGILGIIGIWILSPVAWIMGNSERAKVRAGQYAESSSLTIGWVLGIVGTIIMILGIACIAMMFIAVGSAVAVGLGELEKMTEANDHLITIQVALDSYKAKNDGKLPEISNGPITDVAEKIGLDVSLLDGKNFKAADYKLTGVNAETGDYRINAKDSYWRDQSGKSNFEFSNPSDMN